MTAGWRSLFSHCLLFNPTDSLSARYNPPLEVRRGEQELRNVQNIADILADAERGDRKAQSLGKDQPCAFGRRDLHIHMQAENALLGEMACHDERIIVIEDMRDLQSPATDTGALRTRPGVIAMGPASDPRCVCGPTASSSERFAAPRRSTCSRPGPLSRPA